MDRDRGGGGRFDRGPRGMDDGGCSDWGGERAGAFQADGGRPRRRGAPRHFALWLKEEGAVAISDLHLGFEAALAEQGVSIPRFQRREVLGRLARLLDAYEPEKLIIAGDFKHEFSKNLPDEWVEIKQVLRFLQQRTEPIVVRGHHDNYL